jgi:hypothetical protein
MAADELDKLLNGVSHRTVLDEMKDSYEREWTRKSTLESKANNNITVSGVVITLLFGFVAFIFPHTNGVPNVNAIVQIILGSIILNVICLLLSVLAFRMLNYDYVFSATEKPILAEYKNSTDFEVVNNLIDQYHDAMIKNTKQNDTKSRLIGIAQWFLFAGIVLIPVPVAMLML